MKKIRSFVLPIIFFIWAGGLIGLIEFKTNFPDADSFYHAKMAEVIRDHGFIKTFPWFQETIFANHYVDHHLLYHLFLIPWVTWFGSLMGIKIAAIFFALLALGALIFLLKSWKIPGAWWLTLAAILSSNFLQRLTLPRAPSLSLAFLLIGTWAMLEKKPRWLLIIATTFVWLYNGWPLLIIAAGCLIVGKTITKQLFSSIKNLWRDFLKTVNEEKNILLALFAGLGLGLISHPYFPQNIFFSFLHILQIGFLNATDIEIPVGTEWYPTDPWSAILNNLPTVGVVLLVGGLFLPTVAQKSLAELKKDDYPWLEKFWVTFIMAAGTIILTLKSRRYFEYSIPLIILSAGLFLILAKETIRQELKPSFKKIWQKTSGRMIIISLFVIIFGFFNYKIWQDFRDNGDYFQAQQYAVATDWIKQHVPRQTTIFHNGWDYSPILWYLDDTHYYLAGLDPMFMVDKNSERFKLWQNLNQGRETDVKKIITEFNAPVAIVDTRFNDAQLLIDNLLLSGLFTEVATNQWVRVFATNQLLYENTHHSTDTQ